MSDFDKLTDASRSVLIACKLGDRPFDNEAVATEHILLGLIEEVPELAEILAQHGITAETIAPDLRDLPDLLTISRHGYTLHAEQVLREALRLVRLSREPIEPKHLLLALILQEEKGGISDLFTRHEVDLSALAAEVEAVTTPTAREETDSKPEVEPIRHVWSTDRNGLKRLKKWLDGLEIDMAHPAADLHAFLKEVLDRPPPA